MTTYTEQQYNALKENARRHITARDEKITQLQHRIADLGAVLDLIATGAYPRDGAMAAAKNVLRKGDT